MQSLTVSEIDVLCEDFRIPCVIDEVLQRFEKEVVDICVSQLHLNVCILASRLSSLHIG